MATGTGAGGQGQLVPANTSTAAGQQLVPGGGASGSLAVVSPGQKTNGIIPTIQNVVATVQMGCRLDL